MKIGYFREDDIVVYPIPLKFQEVRGDVASGGSFPQTLDYNLDAIFQTHLRFQAKQIEDNMNQMNWKEARGIWTYLQLNQRPMKGFDEDGDRL